jgi:hypothetical protein
MTIRPLISTCLLFNAVLTAAFTTSIVAVAQFPAENADEACSKNHLKNSAELNGYIFKDYLNKEGGTACVQVIRDGKVIFRRTNDNDGWFQVGQPASKSDHVPAIRDGTDVTGRGHPDMVVAAYSGGAHCCVSHYIFELEPQFKLLAHLDAEDTWPAYFDDLDHDGHYYYIAEDWTFAYWLGSFAGSPNHRVILRWEDAKNGGSYHLALDKMQRPAPTPAEWRKAMAAVRREVSIEQTGYVNALRTYLWQEVMDLIYTGHPDLAWKFLDEAGPEAQRGTGNPDLESFCLTLKASPYWPDLAPTLRDAPAKCLNARSAPLKK